MYNTGEVALVGFVESTYIHSILPIHILINYYSLQVGHTLLLL